MCVEDLVPHIGIVPHMMILKILCGMIQSCVARFIHVWHSDVRNKVDYGVAMISRLLKIVGLFCRISPLL